MAVCWAIMSIHENVEAVFESIRSEKARPTQTCAFAIQQIDQLG